MSSRERSLYDVRAPYVSSKTPFTSMDSFNHDGSEDPPLQPEMFDNNEAIIEILQRLRNNFNDTVHSQSDLQVRISLARASIARINSLSLLSTSDRFQDQLQILSELQNLAYHDTDRGGIQDIAQWCLRSYLQLLAQGHENSPEILAGIGQGWLFRVQATLARIHRSEGSSSSGTSSDRRSSILDSTERVNSITSSEDTREAARQTIEANTRAGGPDYVEARGMLLPATEYLQRAVEAAQQQGRTEGHLLSLAAEAFISLGNVSYSQTNEQYFQQAVRYLQSASRIPGYRLSPYLQSYLDDFGRLLP